MTKSARELGLMGGTPPVGDALVNLQNMKQAPHNRWAFNHVRELVATRSVPAPARTSPLMARPDASLDELVLDFKRGGHLPLKEWLVESYTDAFLVLHRGSLVYEAYLNDQIPSQQHLMFSVTKSFTGAMALVLVEKGLIDETQPAKRYVPELADSVFGEVLVGQLLDMTCSVGYSEIYDDPSSDISRYLASVLPGGEGISQNLVGLKDKADGYEHGDAFYYITPITEALGWVVRRVTGLTLAEALHDLIWEALGAEYDGYYWLDPHGVEASGAGLCISARDAARFGQAILDDGLLDGHRVLPSAVCRRIKTRRNKELFDTRNPQPDGEEYAYGYHDQWWSWRDADAVSAIGIHAQWIYINSDTETVIVKQSSTPDANNSEDLNAALAMHQISAHLAQ